MSSERARTPQPLTEISRCLHHLVGLRSALAPFRATLHALGERTEKPEGRRQLLTLWRPCQEQIDLLSDAFQETDWTLRIQLLRRELEDHLLDEMVSPPAIVDLTESLEQVCEMLLVAIDQELTRATGLDAAPDAGQKGEA